MTSCINKCYYTANISHSRQKSQSTDFYFEKLRGIEVFLQVYEEKKEGRDADELIKKIFRVLYAKAEDNIIVTDDGELLEDISQGQEQDDLLNDSNVSMLSDDPIEEAVDENQVGALQTIKKF